MPCAIGHVVWDMWHVACGMWRCGSLSVRSEGFFCLVAMPRVVLFPPLHCEHQGSLSVLVASEELHAGHSYMRTTLVVICFFFLILLSHSAVPLALCYAGLCRAFPCCDWTCNAVFVRRSITPPADSSDPTGQNALSVMEMVQTFGAKNTQVHVRVCGGGRGGSRSHIDCFTSHFV